jgi:hypothetical protein
MGMPPATYGAHERAEAVGGRDYGPYKARRYAHRFGVTPEWLLLGYGSGEREFLPSTPKVGVVGYVGAGAAAHLYEVAQGDLDEIDPPCAVTEDTVAIEIRGNSLGSIFNRWLLFYDDVRRRVTPDLIGELCVVGLEDGRVLLRQLHRGSSETLFTLISETEAPIRDVAARWAAKVTGMARRSRP